MKRFLMLGMFLLWIAGAAAGLCNDPRPRLVCAEYFASQVVVEATLVKVTDIHEKEDPDGIAARVYSLRANLVLRGEIAGTFRVYEGNDSGRAFFDWKPGQPYLLFLFYSKSEKSWELDGCGNSGPLNSAKAAVNQIEAIQQSNHGGIIHGKVRAMSRVSIEARGENGIYRAVSDAGGRFKLGVPEGHYVVRVKKAGYSFETADFSYENPRDLKVEPGGCVQIAFVY